MSPLDHPLPLNRARPTFAARAPESSPPLAPRPTDAGAWLKDCAAALGADQPALDYLSRGSKSFRFASRFLPTPLDAQVAGIYAFCRFTDDLVDAFPSESAAVKRARLEAWAEAAQRSYDGAACGLPLLDEPMQRMRREGISFAYARELIAGVGMDLEPRPYRTLAELRLYSFRVASVVGLWLTELFGVRDRWVLRRAEALGHAMQWTNILRDVGEDARAGRVYLPEDLLRAHGFDAEALLKGCPWEDRPHEAWVKLTEAMMALADAQYSLAWEGIPHLPNPVQRPILLAALTYQGIHTAIRRNGYDNYSKRAVTTSMDKTGYFLKSLPLLGDLRRRKASPVHANAHTEETSAPESPGRARVATATPEPDEVGARSDREVT